MSNSISAAKRRRAGTVASSPMYQSNNATTTSATSSITESTVKKPMSLQQVIGLFDQRLLYLEDYVVKQMKNIPVVDMKQNNNQVKDNQVNINMNEVALLVQNMISEQYAEFNHRYEVLAEEILNLKMIVMKLQSYTLDVNKALIEERIQLLSDMGSDTKSSVNNVQIQDTLHLREDLDNMMASTQTQSVIRVEQSQSNQLQEKTQEEEDEEDKDVQNKTETIHEEIGAQNEDAHVQTQEEMEAQIEDAADTTSKKGSKKQRQKKIVQATWTDETVSKEINAEMDA